MQCPSNYVYDPKVLKCINQFLFEGNIPINNSNNNEQTNQTNNISNISTNIDAITNAEINNTSGENYTGINNDNISMNNSPNISNI
jgi:hypothetical protein